jgi:hypothetical protein
VNVRHHVQFSYTCLCSVMHVFEPKHTEIQAFSTIQ